MNVELTIQSMFDDYPTLFKDRADCLNHLFCVIGNGYEWINGELVEDIDVDTYSKEEIKILENHLVDGKAFQHNLLSLKEEAEIYYDKVYEKSKNTQDFKPLLTKEEYLSKYEDNKYHRHERRKRWYFYINIPGKEKIDYHYNYSYLWNYPEDIKPDWLEAIEETKTLLREDGFDV